MAHSGYNYDWRVTFSQKYYFQVFTIFFKIEKKNVALQAGGPQSILSHLGKAPGSNLEKFHAAVLELLTGTEVGS